MCYRPLLLLAFIAPILLRAQSAPDIRISPEETTPSGQQMPYLSFSSDNNVLCYWQDERLGSNALYKASLPFQGEATLVNTFTISAPAELSVSGVGDKEWCARHSSQQKRFSYPDLFGFFSNHRLVCNYIVHGGHSSMGLEVQGTFFDVFLPGDTSWISFSRQAVAYRSLSYKKSLESVTPAGYDPGRKELLVLVDKSTTYEPFEHSTWSLIALNRRGTVRWQLDTVPLGNFAALLPVDSLRYLNITDNSATLYDRQVPIASYPLRPYAGQAYYQKILGPYFLRTSGGSPLASRHIEVYHTSDNLVAAADIVWSGQSAALPQAIQRPDDSAFVFLWGTEDNGVHAALLSKDLSTIIADTVLSATREKALNPSGVFKGDSLFIIWEDYRNGDPDIYGTGILLPPADGTASVAAAVRTAARLSAEVRPNPANSIAYIRFNRPLESPAVIELFDLLGARVWNGEIEAGSSTGTVPVEKQRSGAYLLRWRSGSRQESELLILSGTAQ